MLTRSQIDSVVARVQVARDLSPGGTAAMKEVLNAINGQTSLIAYKTENQTGISTVFEDVSGTGLPVAANTAYSFEFHVICYADASTTAIYLSCNGPASPTSIHYTVQHWTSSPVPSGSYGGSYDVTPIHANSQGTDPAIHTVKGILRNGPNSGTLIARIKREAVLGATLDVLAGSFGRLDLLRERDS